MTPDAGEALCQRGLLVLRMNEFLDSPGTPLFHQPGFIRLHARPGHRLFFVQGRDPAGEDVIASAPFWEEEPGRVHSPLRGPFGGFHVLPEFATPGRIRALVTGTEQRLRQEGMREITFVLPPLACYPGTLPGLLHVLEEEGYAILKGDPAYVREVRPGEESFLREVHAGNRKNIHRCERRGYRFREMEAAGLPEAYEVVQENRRRRGYSMTMSLAAFSEMQARLPGSLRCFGAFSEGRLAAAAICVAVHPTHLYVYSWGERDAFVNPSPIPFLARGIYSACQLEGCRTMDVGTSVSPEGPNEGLARFKRSLGFRESDKYRCRKSIG